MASSYPTGLDSLAKPTVTTLENDAGFEHDVVHSEAANAVEAVQSTLGTNPQGGSATVKARLDALDTTVSGKALATRTISTTAPLAGGGDLSADRTLSIADGTTSVKGAVQLTDSTSSTSTTTAATPNAVKSAYDLATTANTAAGTAQTTANAAVPKSTVTTTGDLIVANGASSVTRLAAGTSGQVLTANGAGVAPTWAAASGGYGTIQDEGTARTARTTVNFTGHGVSAVDNAGSTRTDVAIGGIAPKSAAGIRHYPIGSGKLANFGTYQRTYTIPFIGSGNSFTSMTCFVETAGASGVVRMGVYSLDGDQLGVLDFDWGTVSATTTGAKSVSFTAWTPTVGQTYLLAVCIQGNSAVKLAGTNYASATQSNARPQVNVYNAYGNSAYYTDTVTGAFGLDYGYYLGRQVFDFPLVQLTASA